MTSSFIPCIMMLHRTPSKGLLFAGAFLALLGVSACVEHAVTAPSAQLNADPDSKSGQTIATLACKGQKSGPVTCDTPAPNPDGDAASRTIIGGQNVRVKLTASNSTYDAPNEVLSFDVTVQNLLNETIGSPAQDVPSTNGIRVFFYQDPVATTGSGTIDVANEDGSAVFMGSNEPFYQYNNVLAKDAVSPAKSWQFNLPASVGTFAFSVYLETDIAPKLVINELLANPGGTISDANGEWIELYNAGSLRTNLKNLVIADSAASGRRPFSRIPSDLWVEPGAYVVIGNTTNTTNNGGVPVDFGYGAVMAFANSLDAFKISRVYGTDTLTIDRTQYASAAISAQNGISRELKNPALDNSNMDGSNWADASVTAVYGPGGRGTPKAQNSTFTP